MSQGTSESNDPRIQRTRRRLQSALEKLLETQDFDKISVRDITAAATVNRATFYDHYADKTALLGSIVEGRFHELLASRQVNFDGTCGSALEAIVLAVCDYLTRMRGPAANRQLELRMESAVIRVLREALLDGLRRHPEEEAVTPELIASLASWAIYGAAREWTLSADRGAPEALAATVAALVLPLVMRSRPETARAV